MMTFAKPLLVFATVSTVFLAYLLYNPPSGELELPLSYRLTVKPLLKIRDIFTCVFLFSGQGHLLPNFYRSLAALYKGRTDLSAFGVPIEEIQIPGVPVKSLLINPGKPKALIFYHGGGFTVNSPELYLPLTVDLAKATNRTVISIRYRLAPEHPYPKPLDDCMKQTKYILDHASELGLDPAHISVIGDSAGGNIALNAGMMFAKKHVEDKCVPSRSQPQVLESVIPIYPATQMINLNLPSALQYADDPSGILPRIALLTYYQWYSKGDLSFLQHFQSGDYISAKVAEKTQHFFKEIVNGTMKTPLAPLEVVDNAASRVMERYLLDPKINVLLSSREELQKLPKTYMFTCHHDGIRDDQLLFYEVAKNAGVDIEMTYQNDCFHGSVNFAANIESSKVLFDSIVKVINSL